MNAGLAFTLKVTIPLLIKECSAFVFILASFIKDACRLLARFRVETRHVEGCVERPGVPSRNSAFFSLHRYRHWQCDRVYCCLSDRVPLPFLSGWTCPVKNGF